jgi:hypothetical protein
MRAAFTNGSTATALKLVAPEFSASVTDANALARARARRVAEGNACDAPEMARVLNRSNSTKKSLRIAGKGTRVT